MNWWYKEYLIGAKRQTPTEFLQCVYNEMSDREIATSLSHFCNIDVTANAIRKRRKRLNLFKDKQPVEAFNEFVTENNYGNAKAKASNLDDLISQCNIDTDVWEIESFKTWQGYSKIDNELVTIPLSSASFVRKEPIPFLPLIKPLVSNVCYEKPKLHNGEKVKTSLMFSDPHFGFTKDLRNAKLTPFHNRYVLSIIMQVADDLQPNRIDILGDIFDFAEWSDRFLRSPEFYWTTQSAIIEAHYVLANLRRLCPDTVIVLHQGNHDVRLETAIEKYLPAAYDLRPTSQLEYPPQLSIENLLELESLGIEYVNDYPNDFDLLNDNLELMHGNKALAPFKTVQQVANSSNISKMFGHIHRLEAASSTKWTGKEYKTVEAVSVGCTCWIDGRIPGTTSRQQWQNGFAVVEYTDNDYSYHLIPVKNNHGIYTSLFDRKEYLGYGYTEQLKANYPEWNW